MHLPTEEAQQQLMWTLIVDLFELVWRGLRATLGRLFVWLAVKWIRWVMKRPWWAP